MNGWQVAILVAAYAPMLLLWAPALTIGLIDYWRRRTTRYHTGGHACRRGPRRASLRERDYFVRFAR